MRSFALLALSATAAAALSPAAAPPSDGVQHWAGRQAVLEHEATWGTLQNSTECKGRMLAYDYALQLQPARAPLLEVFDALFGTAQGGYQCNVTRPPAAAAASGAAAWPPSRDPRLLPAASFYIDPLKGDDGAAGTVGAPFRTVSRGVAASRAATQTAAAAAAAAADAAAPRAVVLRAGTYYLDVPLALDSRDAGLTLTNYPGEEAWLSGASGGPLATAWRAYNTSNASAPALGCAAACAKAGHCCAGDVSSFDQPSCAYGCAFGGGAGAAAPDAAPRRDYARDETGCRALCDGAAAATCKFEAPFLNGSGSHEFQMCAHCPAGCSAADGVAECYQGCTFAYNRGHKGATLYVTDVPESNTPNGGGGGGGITGLFTVAPHARLTRARYPNARPEDRTTVHTNPAPLHYIAPPVVPAATQVFLNLSALGLKNDSTLPQYNAYSSGVCAGGAGDPACPCGLWTDVRDGVWSSESYWCGNYTAGGWANMDQGFGVFHGPAIPVGLRYNTSLAALASLKRYRNATGAIVNSWRDQGWYNTMFEVASHDAGAGVFTFAKTKTGATKGGFQGGRGYRINNTAGVPHADVLDCNGGWFIENVFEELDTPGEWFFDEVTRKLYVYPNASEGTGFAPAGGAPPASLQFVAPQLSELLGVRGSAAAPVRNVTIAGLGFRDARYTYMDPHGVPSGGDWALERMGALFLEGTEGVAVEGCSFERLDGNGVMLSGYNRGAAVRDSSFAWLGGSAMAAWGYTDGAGSGMGKQEQPRGTLIEGNIARELGVWELQSSMWFQAKSCQTTLRRNLFFNGPRAAINFNDGFGGGNVVQVRPLARDLSFLFRLLLAHD